jgi:GT2 family glycosyltransferase
VEVDQQLAPPVVGVIVVHDVGEWFDETLGALAAQDYPNLRWLMLVTGSEDLEALTQRVHRYLPEAFVRPATTNSGFGSAANEVLNLVEGDNGFFAICHDDIAPARDAIRLMVTELYRSNAGMVGPKLVEWEDPRRLQHVGLGLDRFGEADPIVEPGEVDQEQHDAVRDVFVLPSACMLIRADLFRELGGFDPAISFHGDDVDLCWRAHLSGARVVVAPDASVRHREALELRRPDLPHAHLRARHRMRAVATLTSGPRLPARSVQMVLLALVETVAGLFTGRFGEGVISMRALLGLVPRTGSILARRRQILNQRRVPEREVIGLQVPGSARLASAVRGRETTTYVGAGSTVRRWRPTTYAPLLAWFLVLAAIVIGSRTFIDRGVPQIGEFLAFPDSPRDMLSTYLSGWDARSTGSTAAMPTGWAGLAILSVLAGFRMELAMTISVIGMYVLGATGAWRLATVFPAVQARVAALVIYVGTPLVPGAMATGGWSTLVWYSALPWALYLLRRVAGIGTADPELLEDDLVDGIADLPIRTRIRHLAVLSLVIGLAAAFVPVLVVLWLVVGVVMVLTTLAAGGSVQTAGWMSVATMVGTVAAMMLNFPWTSTWTWSSLVPPSIAGPAANGLVDTASLSVDGRAFAVLALALYIPLLAAVAISRAWRLTWAIRASGLVVVFGGLAVLADRGDLPFAAPEVSLLMVPVALGLALGGASIAAGFGDDVRERGFGWRQPVALLANLGILIGLIPAAVSIGNGAWDAPRTTIATLLSAQLPADPPEGDHRVLFLGDPRVLPVASSQFREGIAYAVVDDGPLGFAERWAPPPTAADDVVTRALDLVAEGSTLRAGRLLAPLGIRYIVVPEVDGARSKVGDPLALPVGLLDSMRDQLDLGETFGAPNLTVFVNRSWIPVTAVLSGPVAQASVLTGEGSLARSDLSGAEPAFRGLGPTVSVADRVAGDVIHLGYGFDPNWWVEVDGERATARPGFGVTTAFDLPGGDQAVEARTGYDRPVARIPAVVVQALLWLLVLAAASRARVNRPRRRQVPIIDETLIQLDDELEPFEDDPDRERPALVVSGVAGEALGAVYFESSEIEPPVVKPPVVKPPVVIEEER